MKIALLGYGKMGKMIEQIALDRGHDVVERIDVDRVNPDVSQADVAIDFSVPSSALKNIALCLEAHVPVVSGTTGWLADYDKAVALCQEKDGAFIYASNFSLGVNLFFKLNACLAGMMHNFSQYEVHVEEIHHTQKLDAPSGTAITLAEGIIANTDKTQWKLGEAGENEIPITAKRIAGVPGTHTISYAGTHDTIDIKHTAHGREGFALGAVVAAEWLVGKKGVYTMSDVLNLD